MADEFGGRDVSKISGKGDAESISDEALQLGGGSRHAGNSDPQFVSISLLW